MTEALAALAYLEEVAEDERVFRAMLCTPGMVPRVGIALFELEEYLTPNVIVPTGPRVRSTGALAAWHDEVRSGVDVRGGFWCDGRWRVDPLREAAAHEAWAKDFDRLGLFPAGDRCRLAAADALTRDAKKRTVQ